MIEIQIPMAYDPVNPLSFVSPSECGSRLFSRFCIANVVGKPDILICQEDLKREMGRSFVRAVYHESIASDACIC
ncbi:unnamed protein product [Dovyalis caffra]|uniref:Uncharacterized protein n=1 Tax=Dovyalis caffra TaxID=77055 RepID=A0AAV1R2Y4_9ROSI|nr:unnamed protein product [Dovyalis caffra]